MDKLLVTGANGMLGSKLVEYFSQWYAITAVDLEPSIFENIHNSYTLDLTRERETGELLNTVQPDVIIHCAGLVNVDDCEKNPELAHRVNVTATEYLARHCSDNTLFVYVSTDQVYGKVPGLPEETQGLQQINHYARTKYQGELAVKMNCRHHIITRTNIFGWNRQKGRVSSAEWIINNVKAKEPIFLFDDYVFSPIYVGLYAAILKQLIDKRFHGVINLGASDSCTKHSFGKALVNKMGLDSGCIQSKHLDDHEFFAERSPDMRLNVNKLRSMGIIPPTYLASIEAFINDNPRPD